MNRKTIQVLALAVFLLFVGVLAFALVLRRTDSYVVDEDAWGQGQDDDRRKQTLFKLTELAACIRVYNKLTGFLPEVGCDLLQSLGKAHVRMPIPHHYPTYYGEEMGDAWGQKIKYSNTNAIATLTSFGPDKIEGTKDDIKFQVRIYDGTNIIWGFSEMKILRQKSE